MFCKIPISSLHSLKMEETMSASIPLVTNGDILKTLQSSAGFTDCYNNLLKTLDLPERSTDKKNNNKQNRKTGKICVKNEKK